jgi:hypothetical protein
VSALGSQTQLLFGPGVCYSYSTAAAPAAAAPAAAAPAETMDYAAVQTPEWCYADFCLIPVSVFCVFGLVMASLWVLLTEASWLDFLGGGMAYRQCWRVGWGDGIWGCGKEAKERAVCARVLQCAPDASPRFGEVGGAERGSWSWRVLVSPCVRHTNSMLDNC